MVNNLPANAGDIKDAGLIPGLEKFLWRREFKPTPVYRGVWWATVHRVAKSRIPLK